MPNEKISVEAASHLDHLDAAAADEEVVTVSNGNASAAAGGGALYGLGVFGAWVFFWQQADAFWEYLLAVLQGVFWPAFMVYEAFGALSGQG